MSIRYQYYLMKTIVPIAIITSIIVAVVVAMNTPKTNTDSTDNNQSDSTSQCIITIQGEQYDVTQFQNLHPGGNIFRCGTDMTSDFENQHGNDLDRIKPYKIN